MYFFLDIIGRVLQYVLVAILNVRNGLFVMQRAVAVMQEKFSVKILNQRLTKIILSLGELGSIVALQFREYFTSYICSACVVEIN